MSSPPRVRTPLPLTQGDLSLHLTGVLPGLGFPSIFLYISVSTVFWSACFFTSLESSAWIVWEQERAHDWNDRSPLPGPARLQTERSSRQSRARCQPGWGLPRPPWVLWVLHDAAPTRSLLLIAGAGDGGDRAYLPLPARPPPAGITSVPVPACLDPSSSTSTLSQASLHLRELARPLQPRVPLSTQEAATCPAWLGLPARARPSRAQGTPAGPASPLQQGQDTGWAPRTCWAAQALQLPASPRAEPQSARHTLRHETEVTPGPELLAAGSVGARPDRRAEPAAPSLTLLPNSPRFASLHRGPGWV